MELNHHFTVPSSLEDTWRSFNQLKEIAPCFPGATLTGVDGDTFTGTVKIKLGPIAMLYTGTGQFVSRNEATHTVVIEAQGKDKRGNGTAGATVTAVLAAAGDGTTVEVSTDMNVTGKPAQFGRGVIQDISDKLLEQFVQCVIRKAAEPEDAGQVDDAGTGATVPGPVAAGVGEAAGSGAPAAAGAASAGTVTGSTTAAPAASPTPAAARHVAPTVHAATTELDLGSAVLPVLAKRFGPAILGALALLVAVIAVCRRGRKR